MKKLRPCLRCDKKFVTTPEVRMCSQCKGHLKNKSWYYNNSEGSTFSTMRLMAKPVDTRSKE